MFVYSYFFFSELTLADWLHERKLLKLFFKVGMFYVGWNFCLIFFLHIETNDSDIKD